MMRVRGVRLFLLRTVLRICTIYYTCSTCTTCTAVLYAVRALSYRVNAMHLVPSVRYIIHVRCRTVQQ